ncbi:MAG TPA: thiamine-binding protein [Bacteroidales bacterium]|nr:thiamine-binding protein [Bacteroidales bacterium]HOE03651.1 thiamine-binding protein [Bacteroidales bacterium]HQL69212.1 thiamine-binding protein [Bacteroidales bacterium]
MSVLMSFAMFPTDCGSSVSPYVSRIVKMVAESGYDYRLTPMATIVETATLQESLNLVDKAYALVADAGNRVYCTATFDIQTNKPMGRITGKIASIEEKIGKVK